MLPHVVQHYQLPAESHGDRISTGCSQRGGGLPEEGRVDAGRVCLCAESHQSCLTLCDPMDPSPPGSCVHWILQARILEWVAISFSKVDRHERQ